VDDIALTAPANSLFGNDLALNQPATASSEETGYPASYGNDGNTTARWSASVVEKCYCVGNYVMNRRRF